MRRKLKIKTGDIVKVIAGNQKGTQGKVLRVFSDKTEQSLKELMLLKNIINQMQIIQKVVLLKWNYLLIYQIFL